MVYIIWLASFLDLTSVCWG